MLSRILKSVVCARQLRKELPKRHISASIEQESIIVVHEKKPDAEPMRFPAVWLRDNCTCSTCFHANSQSRQIDWTQFDPNVRVIALAANLKTKSLHIKWSDQHESVYELIWLKERAFNIARQQAYLNNFYRPKTIHWSGADFPHIVKHYEYSQVMEQDEALRDWLETLAVRGVALIHNAPLETNAVRLLAERVGFIRRTTYGEEFIVQAKPGAKNYAYLSTPLPLHTDLPYYEYKPSVNILHCLVQTESEGGSNLLVDAFHVADRLRVGEPEYFKILSETLVDWNDIGSEDGRSFHNIWRAPVICLDNDGNYARINHSIPQRDSQFLVPLMQVEPWYAAYARFVQLANEDAHTFKTKPGDVLTFNNIRLLHGRTGYDDTEQNSRYIVGAYLDWDIIYSRLRVLKKYTL